MNSDNTTYRGIDYSRCWEYQRDCYMKNTTMPAVILLLKECIDLYIDHGITHKLIHSLDILSCPPMLMQWHVAGDRLITNMSKA